MIINHNIAALTAYRNMTIAGNMVTRSIEKRIPVPGTKLVNLLAY
mgnify:CR=1 FL=1|jgi:hypothetical protein